MSTFPNFAHTIAQIREIILNEFDQEIANQQLWYHNREHIINVHRRSQRIFDCVSSHTSESQTERHRYLLELCAIAHDLRQIFVMEMSPLSPRRREMGISEAATIDAMISIISRLNQSLSQNFASEIASSNQAFFNDQDLEIITEAIRATICNYDPQDQGIYQPSLYENKSLHPVTMSLALADLNGLFMDGIAAYNREGALLFLEENPDLVPVIRSREPQAAIDLQLRERLLRRTNFQVKFAQSRYHRLSQELKHFPSATIPILMKETFPYATPETLATLHETTPIDSNTDLEELLNFFGFGVDVDLEFLN